MRLLLVIGHRFLGFLLRTAVAEPPDLDVRGDDAAKLLHGLGDSQRAKIGALEVPRQPTPHADVVVVALEVRVEAYPFASRAEGSDQPEAIEEPQRPVHGVERHRRHPLLDPTKHGVCIGVLKARSNLAEDLEALVCELDACFLGASLELLDPAPDLNFVDFQATLLPANNTQVGLYTHLLACQDLTIVETANCLTRGAVLLDPTNNDECT